MNDVARAVRDMVAGAGPLLEAIDRDAASVRQDEAAWSKKQILGHLIDSASNNLQRIVRAAQGLAASFPGYDQRAWVDVQRYDEVSWESLIVLWRALNGHFAHVIEGLPGDAGNALCGIGRPDPIPLSCLLREYLAHLRHHLEKIVGSSLPA